MDSCRGQGAMWLRNQLELKLGAHGLLERRVEPRAPGLSMAGTLPSLSPHPLLLIPAGVKACLPSWM